MFNDDAHFKVWTQLQRHLKQGELAAVEACWHAALPSLREHYDELRLLFYVGRQSAREPYQKLCATLAYLAQSPKEILEYRLSAFRYAVETSVPERGDHRPQWMLEDLTAALEMRIEDLPPGNPPIPELFDKLVAEHRTMIGGFSS